jgi:hypothetical protein
MKKVLLTIFAVAITLASCKNYDDDFAALNQTIADLQAQVAGFSTLQTGLTSLQSSVGSLQTTVTALQASVGDLPTDQVDLSSLESDLADALANIASLQTDLSSIVGDYATGTDLATTQTAIDALNTALTAVQADVTAILASNNVYNGDLDLTTAAGLAYATSLGDKVSIVNGQVEVDNTNISVAGVDAVTSKILTVTGLVDVVSKSSVDFSALTSVGGDYTVVGVDIEDDALVSVAGDLTLNYDVGYTQPNLTSAGVVKLADYDSAATGKTGTLVVDFSGLVATSIQTGSSFMVTTGGTAGTVVFGDATSIKFKTGATNVTAPKALTVDMLATNYKTGLTISATKAGSAITIAGRVDSGASTPVGQALSVTGSATSVLNAASVLKVGAVTVTAKTVDFTAMTNATSLSLTNTTPVSLPALKTSGAITAATATSFVAPLLDVSAALTLTLATTVEVANLPTAKLTPLTKVKTLTLNGQKVAYSDDLTAIVTLKAVGVAGTPNDIDFVAASATMKTADFSGVFSSVSVTDLSALTSFTTAGQMNSVTVKNCDALTAVTLGHTTITGLNTSVLDVQDNAKLASLTSSTDYLKTLTVKNNTLLASVNFASYTSVIPSGAISIDIQGNKLTGDFDAAVAATTNSAYVEAVITSADLTTLKPFISAYKAAIAGSSPASTATMGQSVDGAGSVPDAGLLIVNISDISSASSVDPLDVAMAANASVSTVIRDGDDYDSGAGINTDADGISTIAEFLLIQ